MFTYDDGLLAEKLWQELAEVKRDNVLLACQLHVAETVVLELREQINSLMNQNKTSESETNDVKGD